MNNAITATLGLGILGIGLIGQAVNHQKADSFTPTTLYIAIDCSTPEELQYAQGFLQELHQKMPKYNGLIVDVMQGDGLSNRYSDRMSKESIREVYSSLAVVDAQSQSFIQAVHRATLIAAETIEKDEALHVVILSKGLGDPTLLPELRHEINTLGSYDNFKLYIAGLEADTSLKLSSSFSPIQEHIEFSGQLPSELQEVIKDLGEEQK
ncbi:hypothetical protein [Nodosilinea nodulosa]|uniref:hypothetical protein n=1 Tax=Nodosilinea nodulosa TaxID=416001 RepID=UPI0003656438|nr:hypothetical protein [Nodosilinea nodulosa]